MSNIAIHVKKSAAHLPAIVHPVSTKFEEIEKLYLNWPVFSVVPKNSSEMF